MNRITFLVVFLLTGTLSLAQPKRAAFADKCAWDLLTAEQQKNQTGAFNWGYSYANLQEDVARWEQHAFVELTTIGQSVQGRELYLLTIRNPNATPQYCITIHARTHPGEEESFFVTEQMIEQLLANTQMAENLLNRCIFQVIPTLNPDGVELNYARENANGIDIESNWGAAVPEPEVAALKDFFRHQMDSDLPIDIALNMHSAYACTRYFVCHHPNGTSQSFFNKQIYFVEVVQSYFPNAIENYDYYISWANGTPTQYPESWFWNNYTDRTLALTYEDMNCSTAGQFDKTAFAMLGGIDDYLNATFTAIDETKPETFAGILAYPNPVVAASNFSVVFPTSVSQVFQTELVSLNGNEIKLTGADFGEDKTVDFQLPNLAAGIYLLKTATDKGLFSTRIIIE